MKKAILFAMAAAIVAMFAVPGSASAAWTKHHANITANAELELTGTNIQVSGAFGAYECNTISKVDFETTNSSTTGKVTTYKPDGKSTEKSVCKGTGAQAQCEVHDFTADGLPWVIHTVTPDTVTMTTGSITTQNTGFLCLSPTLTGGTLTMTIAAGETNTTSTATLSGTLPEDNPNETVTISGTVHFLGTITYGI
jgi:hypothetical protein